MNDDRTPPEEEERLPGRPNKSRLKRESAALQDLGRELVEMRQDALDRLPLSDELREAVELARGIRKGGGRKRQIKFIGKLLRKGEGETIREALEATERSEARQRARFHELENWRDRLIEEGDDALSEFLRNHPDTDVQHLRQLIRNARRERDRGKEPRAARELFRYLRDEVGAR